MKLAIFILGVLFACLCHCRGEDFVLAEVSVHFSPNGGATAAVVERIAHARTQIRVMAYSFTSKPIIAALILAHKRGVDVQAVLDKKWNSGDPVGKDALIAAGIPVILDGRHPIMHEKVMIIDAAIVLTGSMNDTIKAEKYNAENLVTIRNPQVAAWFLADWQKHASEIQKP